MTHIVLIGAGHTHIGVLRAYAVNGAPDARITLVAPHPRLYYSGMLPAHVAGHYSWAELAIEAGGLLAQLGATFISTHVTGFDGTTLTLADGQRLAGDIVSFDIGTAPGALAKDHPERVIPVKPVEALLEGLARFERGLDQADKARRLAVVGGGAGGVGMGWPSVPSASLASWPMPPSVPISCVASTGNRIVLALGDVANCCTASVYFCAMK